MLKVHVVQCVRHNVQLQPIETALPKNVFGWSIYVYYILLTNAITLGECEDCTFWLASSSLSLVCSCCILLSSSCWLWRRSCISKDLLPLHSTGEFSALRVSPPRPNLPEPIMSRSKGLFGRDELRPKSKGNADPKESEREEFHYSLLFQIAHVIDMNNKKCLGKMHCLCICQSIVQQKDNNWPEGELGNRECPYVCVCLDEVSVRGSPWVEHPPAPTPLCCCCCCQCKTHCVCSRLLSLAADKTWSSWQNRNQTRGWVKPKLWSFSWTLSESCYVSFHFQIHRDQGQGVRWKC